MTAPRVTILVSTYNGERYIRQQLDSLLAQDYRNIQIVVRDDGSTDSTAAIVRSYAAEGKVRIIEGENAGFCASFFALLAETPESDYWSFCDQDDLWYPEKISRAVKRLQQADNHIPQLYYSCSRMVDEHGTVLGIQKPPRGSLCFRRALTGTFGVGFSMVINAPLREAMLRCDSSRVYSHDWLAGAVALGLGQVHVDTHISADYRRLGSSVTRITPGRRIRWFISSLRDTSDVKSRNIEFAKQFMAELPPEQRKYMEWFKEEHMPALTRLKKAFYIGRWRPSMASELSMRLLMLLGKV